MKYAYVTATLGLRLRKSPWGDIITVMPFNSLVEVLEQKPVWWKVKFQDKEGWAYNKYLMEVDEIDINYLHGIDMSGYNKFSPWTVELPDVTVIRFAAGLGLLDYYFGERLAVFRHKVRRLYKPGEKNRLGVYYVYQPWQKWTDQYNYIVEMHAPAKREFFVLDVEIIKNSPPFSKQRAAEGLYNLYLALKNTWEDTDTLIYTSRFMWDQVIGDYMQEEFSKIPLWVAYYGSGRLPVLPTPWKDFVMWQYSPKGRWPNVKGFVDLNRVKKSFVIEDVEGE